MKMIVFFILSVSSLLLHASEKEIWYDYQGKPVMRTDKTTSTSIIMEPNNLVSAQPVNLQKIAPMPWSRSTRYRSNTSRDFFGFYPPFGWISYDCYRPNTFARSSGLSGWYQSNGRCGVNYQHSGVSLQWCR